MVQVGGWVFQVLISGMLDESRGVEEDIYFCWSGMKQMHLRL